MTETIKSATGLLNRFAQESSGTTAIEYAVIAAGIAVAIAATVAGVGSEVNGLYSTVQSSF